MLTPSRSPDVNNKTTYVNNKTTYDNTFAIYTGQNWDIKHFFMIHPVRHICFNAPCSGEFECAVGFEIGGRAKTLQ